MDFSHSILPGRPVHAGLIVAVMVGTWDLIAPAAVAAAETEQPKEIIAAQISRQGYTCKSRQSAESDRAASRPDEAVWVLRCENASYRVRLIPDMAARVERIK